MATPGQEEAWLPPHGPESTSRDGSGDPAQPRSSAVTVRSSIFLNQQRSRVLWTRHGHSPLTAVMHRELRALAQGRPARKGHNWDLDSDHLVPMSRQRCPAPSRRALSDTAEHQPRPPPPETRTQSGEPWRGAESVGTEGTDRSSRLSFLLAARPRTRCLTSLGLGRPRPRVGPVPVPSTQHAPSASCVPGPVLEPRNTAVIRSGGPPSSWGRGGDHAARGCGSASHTARRSQEKRLAISVASF